MKGEKAMEVFKIVKSKGMLPTKLDDLIPLSFIGQAAVEFCTSKIKLMKKLGVAEEQRRATLNDGQDAGELLLEIETRIGELAEREKKSEPIKKKGNGTGQSTSLPSGQPPKHERLGMEKKRMHQAQQIAKHPDVVKKIKETARRNEDIPTKTAVLSEIKYQREKEKRKAGVFDKPPTKRPNIDEFVGIACKKIDGIVSDLFKIVGNVQYIELESTKDTFKSNLNMLSEMIEKLKKELN